MQKKSIIRICMCYKGDEGWMVHKPLQISATSFREAEKIVDYLNSKNTDKTKKYYSKQELITIYKTAEEYISENETETTI